MGLRHLLLLTWCPPPWPPQSMFGMHATFQMFLDKGDVFLLAARRRKKSKVHATTPALPEHC